MAIATSGSLTASGSRASCTASWTIVNPPNYDSNNYTVRVQASSTGVSSVTPQYMVELYSSTATYLSRQGGLGFSLNTTITIPSGQTFTFRVSAIGSGAPALNYKDYTVPVIDRSSNPTLSTTSITLDDTPLTITTNRKSTSFTHTIVGGFSTNAMNDTLAQNVADSVTISSFPVATYASQITDNASKEYIIRTITYYNGASVGQNDKTITLIVPDSIKPSIIGDIEVEDVWCYRNFDIFYNKHSILAAHCTEHTEYGTSIVSRTLNFNGRTVEATTSTVTMTEPISFDILPQETPVATFTIKDGRGRTASKTVPIPIINYNSDFLNIDRVARALSNGTEDAEGTYVKIIGAFNKTSVLDENENEQNFTYIAVYINNETNPIYTSGNVDSSDAVGFPILLGSANSSFDINTTYNIRIIYGDAVSGYHEYGIFTIPTVLRPISINADGSAISFGKPCLSTDRGMYVYYNPMRIFGDVYVTGKVVSSHIGQIIMSTTLNTETAVIAEYGGTKWVQHAGYFLRGASSDVTASYIDENEELISNNTADGGSENAVVVSHTHTYSGTTGVNDTSHYHGTGSTDNPNFAMTDGGIGDEDGGGISGDTYVYPRRPSDGTWGGKSTTGTQSANHAHAYSGTTVSSGESGTGKNMPPYKDVYIWERVA